MGREYKIFLISDQVEIELSQSTTPEEERETACKKASKNLWPAFYLPSIRNIPGSKFLENIWKDVRYAIRSYFEPTTCVKALAAFSMFGVAFLHLFVAAILSGCRPERSGRQMGLYMIVETALTYLFWGGIWVVMGSRKFIGSKALDIAITVVKLFSFAWLLYGTCLFIKYSVTPVQECVLFWFGFGLLWLDWIVALSYFIYGVVVIRNRPPDAP